MDHQLSFADSEFSHKRRQAHKENFLGRMKKLIPWQRLVTIIEPYPLAVAYFLSCVLWRFSISANGLGVSQ